MTSGFTTNQLFCLLVFFCLYNGYSLVTEGFSLSVPLLFLFLLGGEGVGEEGLEAANYPFPNRLLAHIAASKVGAGRGQGGREMTHHA